MTTPSTSAPIFPPDTVHTIRALIRAGSHHPRGMQGKVFWFRPVEQRVPMKDQAKYLAGPYYKTFPGKYLGEDKDAKPWAWFAYPVDLIIDPTEEQIAEETRKVEAIF